MGLAPGLQHLEPLMPADQRARPLVEDERLDEAELVEAPGQRLVARIVPA